VLLVAASAAVITSRQICDSATPVNGRGDCVYGETAEHSGAPELEVTRVRIVPLVAPYDLPVRESSPGGSYGTVPLRRTSELGRSRSGFGERDGRANDR
jgi:hypothetical protein